MKNITVLFFALAMLIVITSCEGDKNEYKVTELVLSLDKDKILDDDADGARVTVVDQNGKDITSMVDILADGSTIVGVFVTHDTPGNIDVHAEYEGIVSNVEAVNVVEDIGLKYKRMILLEQFTGTWCGYCPRAISAIDDLEVLGEDIIHIAYHVWGTDPFIYSYNSTLVDFFNIGGVPSVVAGREVIWNETRSHITSLYKDVRTGLSVSYSGAGDDIEVVVDVRFGKKFAESLNLTVYVIEDELIYDQANYYNDDPSSPWYNLGDYVEDFSHDNVMRKTLTNLFGDAIPADSVDIGSEYRMTLNPTMMRVSDLNNSSVVAFISYGSGAHSDVVINAISCDFGESVESQIIAK